MTVDAVLRRALAAAARAFADELERDLAPSPAASGVLTGSSAAMFEVLRSIARINDELGRGASDTEVRAVAQRVGMDPRGLAGYYSAHLLEKRDDGRWLCPDGRSRLDRLAALSAVALIDADVGRRSDGENDRRHPTPCGTHGEGEKVEGSA
jgi:hypothetical protein